MKYILGLLLAVGLQAYAEVPLGSVLEEIPVQDGGRIKPFGTFARETLQLVYGKSSYENKSPSEVVFTWMLIPDHWMNTPIVQVRHNGLKEALKVDLAEKYLTPQSLFTNERTSLIRQELATLRGRQEKLNPYFQAVQQLENQLGTFHAIRTGTALRLVPDPASDTWKAVNELEGPVADAFSKVTKGFVDSIALTDSGKSIFASPEFVASVHEFMEVARQQAPEKYGDMTRIKLELHLNHFHPFRWAWIAYLVGILLLATNQIGQVSWALKAGWVGILVGFVLHTYGMGLRSFLSGRPPVTNMYETVVWVPWGAVLFAMILERLQKNKLLLLASSGIAVFCLILTDLAPVVLDKSIQPLQPVLRSTFWLTTHVLIITISYAAFFLAFGLGDVLLYYYLKDERRYAQQIAAGTHSIYRCLQIGVVLLAFGIILGGIWADYSWGRFWGWDPKETWALIALLGYLALLHGRLVGWVKAYELAAGAIVSFSLVIMAWYGVNFVLGAGLHSYGFGAGGVEYVTAFVVAHLLYVTYVSTVRYGRLKKETR
ncbi:MAG: cytochrome c biogenesis protein [Bdellovibrionales bacterium]